MDILTVMGGQIKSNKYPYGFDAKELVEGVLHDLGHTNTSYGHWKHSLKRYRIYAN